MDLVQLFTWCETIDEAYDEMFGGSSDGVFDRTFDGAFDETLYEAPDSHMRAVHCGGCVSTPRASEARGQQRGVGCDAHDDKDYER